MDLHEINYLRSFYATQKFGYSYFKDQYALQLLQYKMEKYQLQNGAKIRDMKQWDLGFLMDKKPLKELASKSGNQILKYSDLEYFNTDNRLNFNINFNRWGFYQKHRKDTYYQTTRPGYSLVLRLNFEPKHDNQYYKLIRPINHHPFRYFSHPVCQNNSLTLAWARLDLDLDTGEILIEEIQNDWIRRTEAIFKRLLYNRQWRKEEFKQHWFFQRTKTDLPSLEKYFEEVLMPYKKVWDEAILSAAIWFSIKELGISDIYFHSFEGGCYLKECEPPKSLYTKLPRRFGFKKTDCAPEFIKDCKYLTKKLNKKKLEWWRLNF